ncbi:hypothetical protein KUV62_01825 [Salipiger bermudensis]|uniref:I78 family peptidase inhibitor n=1 Tax=Salipiger bermudensis TaxID=344736 RepID=UPI001C999103|nr:I78 family peptidase inhibitor [Salipiger bermudensis]MBY6002626.1 hypothetical protein [Salipiger bermudensis]
MKHIALMALAALPLTACMAEEPLATDAEDTCGMAAYSDLVGTNVAAVTLPADAQIRVLKQGQPMTLEFLAERLNIETDDDGVILRLFCG